MGSLVSEPHKPEHAENSCTITNTEIDWCLRDLRFKENIGNLMNELKKKQQKKQKKKDLMQYL